MFFGRIVSLVMANAAIVGVFAEFWILSEYAFWILVGALLLWLAIHAKGRGWILMLIIVLLIAAIVGAFIYIPILSTYAFWFLAADYLILVAGTH